MRSIIRRHLTYANLAATLALIFAMSGGAYALAGHGASVGSPTGASAQATVAKSKSKPKAGARGPAGPKGATGAAGATGPAGAAGPAGPAGAKGETGTAGAAGAKGETGPAGPEGKEGKPGTEGPSGPEGSPWTEGGVLPPEATETGVWGFDPAGATAAEELVVDLPLISFPIKLSKALTAQHAHFINNEGLEVTETGTQPPTECKGSVKSPTAQPGNLCIYEDSEELAMFDASYQSTIDPAASGTGVGTTGALLQVRIDSAAARGSGTWAVTAEN
jgi:hypothetical protein